MNASVLDAARRPSPQVAATPAWRWRLIAICAVAVAAAAAAFLGDPPVSMRADPELALLLRGMAAIKGLMVAAALALVAWRVGLPIGRATATGYLAGIAAMAFATVLIWQLSTIVLAAVLFHAAVVALLIIGWRDDRRPSFGTGRRP